MASRVDLLRKIEKKRQEITQLQTQIREAEIYIQAYEEILRMLPRDDTASGATALKPNSAIANARDAIRAAGRPLHIAEILKAIGRPVDKDNRAAIGGSIAAYVRRGEIFTRPAPNTFGLVEINGTGKGTTTPFAEPVPPEDFGKG